MITLNDARLYFQSSVGSIKISIYGSPVANEEECRTITSLETALQFRNVTAGFFAIQVQTDTNTYVINDMFANYRIYYSSDEGYITDEINISKKPKVNINEEHHFAKKGYTSAFGTIYTGVLKLPPLGYLKIEEKSIELHFSFYDFEKKLTVENYEAAIRDRIRSNLAKIDDNEKLILFLSGGIDSIYLAELLIAYKYQFSAVFINYDIPDRDNGQDMDKTQKYCRRRGIKLDIISFGADRDLPKYKKIAKQYQPMDHSFYAFYKASDVLREKYGTVTILNGQSSDSIFCWGISGEGISSKLQRFLLSDFYIHIKSPIKQIINYIYSAIYRNRYKLNKRHVIPNDEIFFNCALNIPVGYVPLIDQSASLTRYLSEKLQQQWVNNPKTRLVHAKLNYLQGSSNQMPIGSSRYGDHNLLMPFLDPTLISLIYANQKTFKRVFLPRYELKRYINDAILKDIKRAVRPKVKDHVNEIMAHHRKTWFF